MWRVTRFGALLGLLTMACGGGGPSIDYADLDQALQQARCERAARCQLFPSEESCMTYSRIRPNPSLGAAIEAGAVRYDGQAAKRCIDETAKQSCDLTTDDAHLGLKSCAEMYRGTREGGEECAFESECVSGTCNVPADCGGNGCCNGTCRPAQKPSSVDGDCAKTSDCERGLVCSKDLKCTAQGSDGANCKSDPECSTGFACVGATLNTAGTCRALPHLGEPCPYQRCSDENLRCDSNSHTCVAAGLPGDSCPTLTECSAAMECNSSTHTCRELPTLGMPCMLSCGGDAFCSDGMCIAPRANGSPCEGYGECETFYCELGPIFDVCRDQYICF